MEAKSSVFKIKGFWFIVLAALAGVILILIGTFGNNSADIEPVPTSAEVTVDSTDELETKLETLIGQIDGVSGVSVMVTFDSGNEYVYARDSDDTGKVFNYVIIDKSTSTETPVLVKEIQPKIRGIAVVCSGGENPSVQAKIISLLSALFNVSSNRVYVTG